jgi:hypothetical protein
VKTAGNYTIQSESALGTFGSLYKNTFGPTYPSVDMLQFNDNGTSSIQFLLSMWLQPRLEYILVATTSLPMRQGDISIIVQDPPSHPPIGVRASVSGLYILQWNSTLDTAGYIFNSTLRQITDVSGGISQFLMMIALQAMFNYTLLVSTYSQNDTGPFSISARGHGMVTFSPY